MRYGRIKKEGETKQNKTKKLTGLEKSLKYIGIEYELPQNPILPLILYISRGGYTCYA